VIADEQVGLHRARGNLKRLKNPLLTFDFYC
jgi:hypothetical protein